MPFIILIIIYLQQQQKRDNNSVNKQTKIDLLRSKEKRRSLNFLLFSLNKMINITNK